MKTPGVFLMKIYSSFVYIFGELIGSRVLLRGGDGREGIMAERQRINND